LITGKKTLYKGGYKDDHKDGYKGGKDIIIKTRHFLVFVLVFSALSAAGANIAARASGTDPGSAADPLTSKSYVDLKISEISTTLNNVLVSGSMQTIELKKGQQLLLGIGTQIVVRSGTAMVIKGTYGGLSDLTTGTGLDESGETIQNDHLLTAYRDDGRGIEILGDSVWVAVTGPYTVK